MATNSSTAKAEVNAACTLCLADNRSLEAKQNTGFKGEFSVFGGNLLRHQIRNTDRQTRSCQQKPGVSGSETTWEMAC